MTTGFGVNIAVIAAEREKIKVSFTDGDKESYDALLYFLGGSRPQAILEKTGVAYAGNKPLVDSHGESNIPWLFLAGVLTAEKGTIMTAFNSSVTVMKTDNFIL